MYERRGSLFVDDFERNLIEDNQYFRNVIHYIHYNPVHHEFVTDLRDWKFSSFETFFNPKATLLKRDEVIEWYGNKQAFLEHHNLPIDKRIALDLEFI